MSELDIEAAIAEVLGPCFGAGVRIDDLRPLSSGASRRSFGFTAVPSDGEPVKMILQAGPRASGGSGAGPVGALAISSEAELLERAAANGVPVPALIASGGAQSAIGSPFLVTGFLPGEALPSRLFREAAYSEGLTHLTTQAAEALAAIHRMDPSDLDLFDGDFLKLQTDVLDLLQETRPVLEYTLYWLAGRRPTTMKRCVVHGDFRLGNLLVDETGLQAVLDWELAHVGDPLEDVAWATIRAWRFDKFRPPGVFPEVEPWLAAYEASSGRTVDPDAFKWWQVASTLRWAVICLVQAHRHLSGITNSLELAVVGRRVFECEWDLLCLLGPVEVRTRAADALPLGSLPAMPSTDLHGTTTAAVLIEAVRELLEKEVSGVTEGSVRHHVRIASNALGIVSRELALGPAQESAHRARLSDLGVTSDAELATALRRGDLADEQELLEVLVADTRARLEVANPAWLVS